MTTKKNVNVVPVTIVKTVKGIAGNIALIKTSGKAFESLVHSTAVSILMHVGQHGNINQAIDLVNALPSLTRKNALIAWLVEFGCFGYNEKTKSLVYRKATTRVDEAIKTPFWLFKQEPDFVAMTPSMFLKAVENLVKRAEESLTKQPDEALAKMVSALKVA